MKILVIGNNWLGDVVMSLPAIFSLKKDLNVHITIVTKRYVKDVYELFNWIDEISITEAMNLKNSFFDHSIILPRSINSFWLSLKAKCKSRIGYSNIIRAPFLTKKLKRTDQIAYNTHRVYYFYNLAKLIGVTSAPELPEIDHVIESPELNQFDGCVIFCPGAKYGEAKMWPEQYFIELGKSIYDKTRKRIIIIGSSGEAQLGRNISQSIPNSISLCGKTSIKDLVALFNRAKILVTKDTGPMHLASLTKVPIVAIFGSTSPVVTSPFRTFSTHIVKKDIECSPCLEKVCPLKHHLCMKNISPQDVLDVVSPYILQ